MCVAALLCSTYGTAHAQNAGALAPHEGLSITTAFSNTFGPDAESSVTYLQVTGEGAKLLYRSTRGLIVEREVLAQDRASARRYVLGYAKQMPSSIPGSTSMGISGAVLDELRSQGKAPISLIYDAELATIDGVLTLAQGATSKQVMIDNQPTEIPVVHAIGAFGQGDRTGTADFYFMDDRNGPLAIESAIKFSWEEKPRLERVVAISAGTSMQAAMAQSLSTLRRYDLYGLHFEFNKATLQPDSALLIDDIAATLNANPAWRLQIAGHTDSIGEEAVNLKLSAERAASVKSELVKRGVAADRLVTAGLGESEPKGDNATLEGRALNRRVELVRTDN